MAAGKRENYQERCAQIHDEIFKMNRYSPLVQFIRNIYQTDDFIPLHAPSFIGDEKKILAQCIDSTFVSSVGEFVNKFEQAIAEYTKADYAVATVNGGAALHVALELAGVGSNDEVITQSLTYVATCNAVSYCGAYPVFVDVEPATCGMSPDNLLEFLQQHTEIRDDGVCVNKTSKRPIKACVPMHTFGHPARVDTIKSICDKFNITLIEDAAESLGSFYRGRHTGTFGEMGVLSFNGNKIITAGGGGMIITDNEELALKAKHITTGAKLPHRWEFRHDMRGYNYRLPNLNAALGVAQSASLENFVRNKRELAQRYRQWGSENGIRFLAEPENAQSNCWLNTIIAPNRKERDEILHFSNDNRVMTRPVWTPMHEMDIYRDCSAFALYNTRKLADILVNVPSSPVL